jgi:hypothetical protein
VALAGSINARPFFGANLWPTYKLEWRDWIEVISVRTDTEQQRSGDLVSSGCRLLVLLGVIGLIVLAVFANR